MSLSSAIDKGLPTLAHAEQTPLLAMERSASIAGASVVTCSLLSISTTACCRVAATGEEHDGR